MIYTGYFAKLKIYPKDIIPIAIVRFTPRWLSGILTYPKLAPSVELLNSYKANPDVTNYINIYYKEVLDKLDPFAVYSELMIMSEGNPIILCCYETPEKFCHRHVVAKWLSPYIEVKEL